LGQLQAIADATWETNRQPHRFVRTNPKGIAMPTTTLPESKEKAAEISRKITNTRPSKRDKEALEGQVTGGFNQKKNEEMADQPRPREDSATHGDGQ
jgi:hypothetical protein